MISSFEEELTALINKHSMENPSGTPDFILAGYIMACLSGTKHATRNQMMRIECDNTEAVVKEAFFLAYQACGGPVGYGRLQARQGATKDQVWANVATAGDYPMNLHTRPGQAYGDYVFGRMVKLLVKWDATGIEIDDSDPHPEYQMWCRTYTTYRALIDAAIAAVQMESVAVKN